MFVKERVLKIFVKFTEKHLFQSLSFNKVAGLRPVTLLKKRLWHRCFPVNFARIPFLQNTSLKTTTAERSFYGLVEFSP